MPGAGALGGIQVPGDLVINNGGTVAMTVYNGQIARTSNVTINGGGVLTLFGNNTLGSLTINNNSGTATPTVTPGSAGNILFLSNPVVNVTSDNAGSTATIGTGNLNFSAAPTFNTSTNTPERLTTDLLINSVITNTLGFGWQIAPSGTNPLQINVTKAARIRQLRHGRLRWREHLHQRRELEQRHPRPSDRHQRNFGYRRDHWRGL